MGDLPKVKSKQICKFLQFLHFVKFLPISVIFRLFGAIIASVTKPKNVDDFYGWT